jgi:hypothetical protein
MSHREEAEMNLKRLCGGPVIVALVFLATAVTGSAAEPPAAEIDAVFADYDSTTSPGSRSMPGVFGTSSSRAESEVSSPGPEGGWSAP